MSFNIPNTFVAGTKAKADEVNENFLSIEEEVNKANTSISLMKQDIDYIKNDLINEFAQEAQMAVNNMKSKFCINYANTDETGKLADIFSVNGTVLGFKVGGNYPILVGTNAWGESEAFESIENVSVANKLNGTYNLFLSLDGTVEFSNTNFFRSPKEPKGVVIGDIWLMTMEPWCCYKFNGISWVEFNDIPIGKVTVDSGNVQSVENLYLNTQYLDSDCLFLTQRGRGNISKRFESPWFNGAPCGLYHFEHNLGLDPAHYRVRIIARVKENFDNFKKGDIIEALYSNISSPDANAEVGMIIKYNETSIDIGMGNSPYHCCNNLGGVGYGGLLRTNVEYKAIVTQDVN